MRSLTGTGEGLTDVIHWMWPLFTDNWGSWRSEDLRLSPCPFTDPVTGLPTWHDRPRSPLLLYGFSQEIVECPVLDIDAVGTFTMCHEALKYLKKGGLGKDPSDKGGTIINISATLHYTATRYQIHVSAAKAAVDSTTQKPGLEWGTDYDIRVNGITSGPIEDTASASKRLPESIADEVKKEPLYKFKEKWDIAMAALYLTSDAGKYVNGTTLVVDGGL